MNQKTCRLIRKAVNHIDPQRSGGTLRDQRRAWCKIPWNKRHKARLDLVSVLEET
jgi:hypothetical protein